MKNPQRSICLTAVICISLLSGQALTYSQTRGISGETATEESNGPQVQSAKRRIMLNIARAVLEVLCAEYGDCSSTRNPSTETTDPSGRTDERYLTPGFGGGKLVSQPGGFSFDTPLGWQSYEDRSSVTVARPSEYVNGNLINGVILGLFDLNGGNFESVNEKYVRGLISNNKYLSRMGWPESNVVNNVPCITTRLEGRSPKTQYVEKVIVYTCKRNAQKLFYVVTVNSGPNANQYESENSRITQSISFR